MRRRHIDATSVYDIKQQGWDDESVLTYAAREIRVLVTHNIRHFVALHRRYVSEGRTHAGIVLTTERYIGRLQEALLNLTEGTTGEDMTGQIRFL